MLFLPGYYIDPFPLLPEEGTEKREKEKRREQDSGSLNRRILLKQTLLTSLVVHPFFVTPFRGKKKAFPFLFETPFKKGCFKKFCFRRKPLWGRKEQEATSEERKSFAFLKKNNTYFFLYL